MDPKKSNPRWHRDNRKLSASSLCGCFSWLMARKRGGCHGLREELDGILDVGVLRGNPAKAWRNTVFQDDCFFLVMFATVGVP